MHSGPRCCVASHVRARPLIHTVFPPEDLQLSCVLLLFTALIAGGMGGMGGMGGGMAGGMGMMGGLGMGGMAPPNLEAGRVILCLPDMSLVDFFRQQFAALPAPFEVYPAVGPDMAIQLARQGLQLGGTTFVDFVLLHPDFLHNKSPVGLIGSLKGLGMRLAAFGWQPAGPVRDLIESAGVDGWMSGPVPPQGINRMEFMQLIARMQGLKKGGAVAPMGGMGGLASPRTSMAPPATGMMSTPNSLPRPSAGGMGGGMGGMGGAAAANPLFNAPPSPMVSQPGMTGGAATPAGGVNADNEAAMMQQLMQEINQLRAELNQ